jgi:hypothetical protein
MRLILIALALLSGGISVADQAQPRLVRVYLQFIDVPHPVLTQMLAEKDSGGARVHSKALALANEGKAKVLETCMVLGRSGEKFTLESIREEIYPTEYSPPGLPGTFSSTPKSDSSDPPTNPMFRAPTAFETRNTGVTVDVEPTLAADGGVIDLRITSEVVTPLRLETLMEHKDQWGDGSIRMPVFETWRASTSVSVVSGKFELVSVISPRPKNPVPAVLHKILVFVRADIVPVPVSP